MDVAPSLERLRERVRVSFYDDVLGMTCIDCEALELVRGDQQQFNDEVRRFLRTHPGACGDDEQPRSRRLVLAPAPPS